MARTAIVTGGSRGIGASICRLLGAAGWNVVVNYAGRADAAQAVAREIEASGGQALVMQADVARKVDVDRLFAACDEAFGGLDALVNNAGVIGRRGRFEDLDDAVMAQVLAINVLGCMLCAHAAIPRLSTRHGGRGGAIVNISSGNALSGGPGESVLYSVSKGAVNSLTIGLSQELAGEGIRVNTVSPGLTDTDMPGADKIASIGPTIPIGRVAHPDEIAEGVIWLLSDKASYVAGANLRIGGGRP
ncbi:MAG: SDR family oxidoreductase [Alphaproteobacteria bacterium]|nr:SDR family oxidoreductase [Alphaproteobacteria bacterium]